MTVAYVALLDVHADGGPDHPTWSRTPQGSTGWTLLGLIRARYMAPIIGPPPRGLFALIGPVAEVESMGPEDEVMPALEMQRRAAENEPTAETMLRSWRTWIVDDDDGTEHKATILNPGETLLATLPSPGTPFGPSNVTKLYRAALAAYRTGSPHHMQMLEDEPDRSPP